MSNPQDEAIEGILAILPGTVFRSDDTDAAIVLTDSDTYAIAVFRDGSTESAYLVTVPPDAIATAIEADRGEVAGWSTGWEA